ncbi:hypothetical protein ACQCT3_02210 [Sutcliffiella horikoshii]
MLPASVFLFVGGVNYYVDPLWNFSHENSFNDSQEHFNERQQKTNMITFRDFDYDALLIGSSRSTYINQNEFGKLKTFNYSVSSMSMQEYNDFIEYAKKQNKKEFEYIFIGLDFFATDKTRKNIENPMSYINNTNEFAYRIKSLLSIDLFKQSLENARSSRDEKQHFLRSYDRNNVASAKVFKQETVEKEIKATVENYKKNVYGKGYKYNEDVPKILLELKKNNPDTKFVIYTTPVTSDLFAGLHEVGRLEDYNRWLTDIVDVFGSVHNFMYVNSITQDTTNYYDGHHAYPEIGTMIAHKIADINDPNIPDDFGVLVTTENIKEHLNYVEVGLEKHYVFD